MDEKEIEQKTTIKGYIHPKNLPKYSSVNKFSIVDKTLNVEPSFSIDTYQQDEQDERERMMREIEAKYRPLQYKHSQKAVSSSTSPYSTLQRMTESSGKKDYSMFWTKRIDTRDYTHCNEDKSQVRHNCDYNFSEKLFRKHQMPLSIIRGMGFQFSPNPEADYNAIRMILNEPNVSVSVHADVITKEGYRDQPKPLGDKMFGTAIFSPQMLAFQERMRHFVPAVVN